MWTERDKAGVGKALTSQETLSFLAVYVCVSQPQPGVHLYTPASGISEL